VGEEEVRRVLDESNELGRLLNEDVDCVVLGKNRKKKGWEVGEGQEMGMGMEKGRARRERVFIDLVDED